MNVAKMHRLSQKEKEANDYWWYKQHIDLLDSRSNPGSLVNFGETTDYRRMKVNYDLVNNIINVKDFEYVCKPFGAQAGELPAKFANRDIISGKVKALMGMEIKRPFSWKVMALNEEATTRKEQEKFQRIQQFVIDQIMGPIRQRVEAQKLEEMKGRKLSEQELQELQQQMEQEVASMTPEEVKKYMEREHQDPAEAMAQQLLTVIMNRLRIREKFNKGWQHFLTAGKEIYWTGIVKGVPTLRVINPLYFDYDKSPDNDYIEEGMWAKAEFRMNLADIMKTFDLTKDELDSLTTDSPEGNPYLMEGDFSFTEEGYDGAYYRVVHSEWIAERKIGWLTYRDENGMPQKTVVPENYRLNRAAGDISVEWQWIPEKHEGYKIGRDIYKGMGPVDVQGNDITDLYNVRLSYIGAACDNLNSQVTSLVDRMKPWQYYYNIIMYRIEMLMASDKGKKLAANINMVPKSAGIDVAKWMYFADANNLMWFNPNEEGNRGSQDTLATSVKEIDMSLASDIQRYINLAEYVEEKCGMAVGITKTVEGQIGPDDAVTNTRQNLIQTSHILEPYFYLHSNVKRNVLDALLGVVRHAYSGEDAAKLAYVTDDMTQHLLTINGDLLSNSTYGIFIDNSVKAVEAKQLIENLAQSAMQNMAIDLSDVIKVVRSEGIQEAEELLERAEQKKREEAARLEQQRTEGAKEVEMLRQQGQREQHEQEKELIVLKEKERRTTELQKQAMLSAGFNQNKDVDEDGKLDIMEIYQDGRNAEIEARKQALAEDQFEHQKEVDKKKLEIEEKKIKASKAKKR